MLCESRTSDSVGFAADVFPSVYRREYSFGTPKLVLIQDLLRFHTSATVFSEETRIQGPCLRSREASSGTLIVLLLRFISVTARIFVVVAGGYGPSSISPRLPSYSSSLSSSVPRVRPPGSPRWSRHDGTRATVTGIEVLPRQGKRRKRCDEKGGLAKRKERG